MKYSAVILAASTGLVAAQSAADFFPECAISCLDAAVLAGTTCTLDDAVCQCTAENQALIQGGATACVIEACGAAVAVGEVLPAAETFCAAVAAGGSATTTAEAETTTAAEETTPAEETTAEETTAAEETTSAAEETTSAEEEPTTAVEEPTTLETSTPTATGNGTAETTTPVEVSGVAGRSVGGFVAVVLAALAAI